jgi:Cu(I)/Ag(I) efflux system membrane fusion protein
MWEGDPRWIQPSEELANPYMGAEMLTCGSEKDWTAAPLPAAAEHEGDPDEISHYTCPMHPWVREDNPRAKCPVCGMDLAPVTKEEVRSGIVRIDRERRQAFGVTTEKVERRRLIVPVRASGRVAYDERGLFDVTLKYKGWIERLHVEETGERVKKGQPLFSVYSPEMFAAQHELILAAQAKKSAATEMQRSRAEALLMGSRKRMRLWDLGPGQIDRMIARGEPLRQVPVPSPASGYVIEKDVVEGAAVEPGQRLFRIADLARIWVEAEIYERDIALVEKGQAAKVTLAHLPGRTLLGSVSFIHPTIDPRTRTARVRIELENRKLELKPDMFAAVDIAVDMGERLVIPEPAILYSGPRRIVFVDVGEDRLRPTIVETGAKSDGLVEVLSGLEAGDEVVVSGNFLVAAESRLKSATGIW